MEKIPETDTNEDIKFDLDKEIQTGLSRAFFKSVQEILPGKIRPVPKGELSEEELQIYREAYVRLAELVREGVVENDFREEDPVLHTEGDISKEQVRTPVFKYKYEGGKKEPTYVSPNTRLAFGQN